jgi:integrase
MPKRNQKTLTEVGIKRLAKAEPGKRKEISDALASGLVLRVTDKGAKSFSVYYRRNGKNTRLTLGPWPGLGIEEARVKAREVREWARKGIDPKLALRDVEAKERTEIEEQNRAMMTFVDLATAYINRETPKLAQGEKYAGSIRQWLLPAWRHMPVEELRRRHLTAVTDQVLDKEKPAMACRVHEIAKRIFTWGLDRGDVEFNPFAGMRPPVTKKPRDRVLKRGEIADLWVSWDGAGYPFGALQKLLLLTGQRRGEVAEMCWSEVDFETATWTIPAARSKSNREMLVPLSDLAVELLESSPRFEGCDFVFTSRGKRPVSGFSKARVIAERESGVSGWRLHDLRRTCRTGLARLGVAEIVAERCLNHAPKGLSAVYNVHEYQDEKREAFQKWADEVRVIANPPPKVVRLETA